MSDANLIEASDARLVRAMGTGEEAAAVAVLFARHGPAVYAAARRQTGDASLAEDITQAVFIVLIKSARSIRRPELLPGWLMKVTRYCVLNARRSDQRRSIHESAAAAKTEGTDPGAAAAEAELLAATADALAKLPNVDRAVLTMAYLQSQSVEQISKSLGMTTAAVRKRTVRAIDKMRRSLAHAGVSLTPEAAAGVMGRFATPMPPTLSVPSFAAQAGSASHSIARGVLRQMRGGAMAVVIGGAAIGIFLAMVVIGGAVVVFHRLQTRMGIVIDHPAIAVDVPVGRRANRNGPFVYESDFATDAADWSTGQVGHTPNGNKPFLGPLGVTTVKLHVIDLPPHDLIEVQADLFILMSWDGCTRVSAAGGLDGPDFFTFGIDNRPPVIRAIFSEQPDDFGFAYAGGMQTYPAVIPGFPGAAGTGADAINSLGYIESYFNGRIQFPADGIWHLDVKFPHTAGDVELFASSGAGPVTDEGWGLANVKVKAIASDQSTTPTPVPTPGPTPVPTGADLDQWWQLAVGSEPVASRGAFLKLLAAGLTTVEYLRHRTEAPGFNTADVQSRLKVLTGKVDPESHRDLVSMGPGVEALLCAEPQLAPNAGPADTLGCITSNRRPKRPTLAEQLKLIYQEIELRPIEDASLRAAVLKARLLAQINSPEALQLLREWIDAAPAWQPDSSRQFDADYILPAGEALRYVAAPNAAARSEYIRRHNAIVYNVQSRRQKNRDFPVLTSPQQPLLFTVVDDVPDLFTPVTSYQRQVEGVSLPDRVSFPSGQSLQDILSALENISIARRWTHVLVPNEFRSLALPGDWLIKYGPAQQPAMRDLQTILTRELHRKVVVALGDTGDEVKSVLSVNPGHKPATQTSRPSAISLDIYVDEQDRADPGVGRFGFPLRYLANQLQYRYGRTIVVDDTDMTPLVISTHPKAAVQFSRDEAMEPANSAIIDKILDNIASQLDMKRVNQPLNGEVYRVSYAP